MSDNLRQYRAIRAALRQAYPGEPQGRCARHLTTLAAMISGIVASKSTQLPKVAAKVPTGAKPESRVKRFARWLDNERILEEVYFLPHGSLIFVRVLRIYNVLYFLRLYSFHTFCMVWEVP